MKLKATNDLGPHIQSLHANLNKAIARVIESGWFVLGAEVSAFENAFAAFVGVDFCRTVANGTDALELGLLALGVHPGDKVATVANAGFYASTALLAIGATPLYMDVDIETRVVTLNEIERVIQDGVKAIVVTHLYGQAVPDIEIIAARCKTTCVLLAEDCAQAHGAKVGGRQVGSFGDIGCFSFYPTKNLGALGDGGAILTKNHALAERVVSLRQYGWSAKYQVELPGARNSRLDEMQAAILLEFLPYLDSWNKRRREIAAIYSMQINNEAVILPPVGSEDYVAHLYVIRTRQRLSLQAHLRKYEIACDIHYPIPDTRQPIYEIRFNTVSLPNTELLAEQVLTLPCYPEMTDAEVQHVVATVNGWQP